MKAVTWLGSWVALVATGILLVVLAFLRRLPVAVVLLAAVAWAGEAGGVTLAKHVVEREPARRTISGSSRRTVGRGRRVTRPSHRDLHDLALVVAVISSQRSRVPSLAWVIAALAVGGGGVLTYRVGGALEHRRHSEHGLCRCMAGGSLGPVRVQPPPFEAGGRHAGPRSVEGSCGYN